MKSLEEFRAQYLEDHMHDPVIIARGWSKSKIKEKVLAGQIRGHINSRGECTITQFDLHLAIFQEELGEMLRARIMRMARLGDINLDFEYNCLIIFLQELQHLEEIKIKDILKAISPK